MDVNAVFRGITEYTEKVKQEKHASGSALVIMKDNKIIHEWYSGTHHFENGARKIDETSRFNVYSTRVTYVGLAIAIAIQEGYLELDEKISSYLNEYDKEILGDTTIRHLVTRCTGLKFVDNNVYRVFEEGTGIEGKRPEIVAKVLYRATGKTVNEVLSDKVFKPMNWRNSGWVTQGENNLVCDINLSESYPALRIGSDRGDERNLYVSPRELAFWGNLHLHKGMFEERQILPKEVFDLATSVQSPHSLPQYFPKFGFLWWIKDSTTFVDYNELGPDLPEGSYQILGASGCSCTVIPEYNAVAVRMYNSLHASENLGFDYIKDIQRFGNMLVTTLNECNQT